MDEANALLGEMEEVFRTVDGLRQRLRQDRDRLKILDVLWGDALEDQENPDRREYLQLQGAVDAATHQLEGLIRKEILDRGIRFPPGALEHGLLDFPTTYRGRWVFLCWRRGEPRIVAWHELQAGFRGRRRLTHEQALEMGRGPDAPPSEDPSEGPSPPPGRT